MTKQFKNKCVDQFSVEYDTLKDVLIVINGLIEKHGEDAVLKMHFPSSYSDYESMGVFKDVLETDKEYEIRLKLEAENKVKNDAKELAEYERLKQKFGNV